IRQGDVLADELVATRVHVERRQADVIGPRRRANRRDDERRAQHRDAKRPDGQHRGGRYQAAAIAGKPAMSRSGIPRAQRRTRSHHAKSRFTRGVRRVRFQASAAFLMASAWVGYGWMTFAIVPKPALPAIATDTSEMISPACAATSVAPRHRWTPAKRTG